MGDATKKNKQKYNFTIERLEQGVFLDPAFIFYYTGRDTLKCWR